MKKLWLAFLLLFVWPAFLLAADRVDINTASIKQLDGLAGIGPALAQRIVDGHPYYYVDDLLHVKGIGQATLKKIKDQGLAYVAPEMVALAPPAAKPRSAKASSLPKTKKIDNNVSVAPAALSTAIDVSTMPDPRPLFTSTGAVIVILGLLVLLFIKLKRSKVSQ